MASGDTIRQVTLIESAHGNPNSARVEERSLPDANLNPTIRRRVAVFYKDTSGLLVPPQIVDEFIMPRNFAATTGLTVDISWQQDPGAALSGNVVWEFACESLLASTALNLTNADNWGTPTVATAAAVPATAGYIVTTSVALVKANAGPQALVAGTTVQMCRIRVRRMTVVAGVANALDTFAGPAIVLGIHVRET